MKTDYLIVGSGLAALSFGALMAKAGKRVKVLEAHYLAGGYGHTFQVGDYKFNAQLHYVWNCGEGRTVYNMLKKLNLHQTVTFQQYDGDGFDHMRMPGYALDIPYSYNKLAERLQSLFPPHAKQLKAFVQEIEQIADILDNLPKLSGLAVLQALPKLPSLARLAKYKSATLQDVFDQFRLPLEAQTLIALQWPDFLLPPNQLSFFAWLLLFAGYCRGAYYPTHHFEHVIDSLVKVITDNGGEVLYEHKVIDFMMKDKTIMGVLAENLAQSGQQSEHLADVTVCNMDPRRAAEVIGLHHFSQTVRKKLNYEYSPSNFMAYCVVDGLNLSEYGFGKWNLFHTEEKDLNKAFYNMYYRGDYSKPSFAVTTPGLLTTDQSDCPPGQQIIEFLTVANYYRFLDLKISDPRAYRNKKQQIFDCILDVMEKYYIPNLREHLVFKMTGSPTTNERYCWSPAGNSYGSNMTPQNIGPGRLDYRTSLKNFYFCNASSGYAGFAGTIWTGCNLYEVLSGDTVL